MYEQNLVQSAKKMTFEKVDEKRLHVFGRRGGGVVEVVEAGTFVEVDG